jgi:CBS-domain-containing membrane protein
MGMVSDRRLLTWFYQYAQETPSLSQFLSIPLHRLSLPSLNLNLAVVAARSDATVLDAMKLMSEQGVGSIAVVDGEVGNLLSAVSVTDIGRVSILKIKLMSHNQSSFQIVVPSQSNQILSTPLHQFIWLIKASTFSVAVCRWHTDGQHFCECT